MRQIAKDTDRIAKGLRKSHPKQRRRKTRRRVEDRRGTFLEHAMRQASEEVMSEAKRRLPLGRKLDLAQDTSVDHPAHYGGDVVHEHIKCITAWGLDTSYRLGNATKYLARAGKKDDSPDGTVRDLRKAIWYIQSEIDRLEGR